jgi:integrase
MPGSVYKRGDIYWIKFYYKGKAYRTSAKTVKITDAKKLLSRYLGEVASGTFKGLRDETVSVQELFDDFEEDCRRRKLRNMNRVVPHMKPIRAWFGAINTEHITERDIDRYIKHRLQLGRSTTTVNRELQYLGQSLRRAKKKKLIEHIPLIERFREDNARQGFFEPEDFERLVAFLPEDLKDFVRFGYYSGWRAGEIAWLEWRDVNGDLIRLRPETVKNKEGRALALVGELADIIARRKAVRLDQVPWIFHRTRRGKIQRVRRFDKAWKRACRNAGIPEGRVFHDLRRTTARNLSRAGVPDRIAMSIMGHKTRAMYDRYNIVNEQDIREGLIQMQHRLKVDGHNLGTK